MNIEMLINEIKKYGSARIESLKSSIHMYMSQK